MRLSREAPANLPASQTDNPYWQLMRSYPGSLIDWAYDNVWAPDWTAAYLDGIPQPTRKELCCAYSWAIPDPLTLAFVAEWLQPHAIEIGAGTGYWSWQLSQLGNDIIAFDEKPPHRKGGNSWHSLGTDTLRSVFFDVQEGTPDTLKAYPDRALFLCWPPQSSDMALNCLQHYQGKRLVYIGEQRGGHTASNAFFDTVEQEWQEIATHHIIQWTGSHDRVTVYERRDCVHALPSNHQRKYVICWPRIAGGHGILPKV